MGEQVYLRYFGRDVRGRIQLDLSTDKRYTVEAVDTWNMTRQVVARGKSGSCKIRIPEKQWIDVIATAES